MVSLNLMSTYYENVFSDSRSGLVKFRVIVREFPVRGISERARGGTSQKIRDKVCFSTDRRCKPRISRLNFFL